MGESVNVDCILLPPNANDYLILVTCKTTRGGDLNVAGVGTTGWVVMDWYLTLPPAARTVIGNIYGKSR